MKRCLGWHDMDRRPVARWEAVSELHHGVHSCDVCKPKWGSDLNWRRITLREHFLAGLSRPFSRLDQWLYCRGFRWKNVDWLGLWADRIYHGRFPFRPLRRPE